MDPALAQGLATLCGAIASAILMYAAYHWGPNARQRPDDRDDYDRRDRAADEE